MSDELKYIQSRLDDVIKGVNRLERKIDDMRDDHITQRAELAACIKKLEGHEKLLVLGNGQKPLTVQMAETKTRLDDAESDISTIRDGCHLPTDPADLRKERVMNIGKVLGIVGIIVSQVLTWVFAVPGK